MLICLLLLGCNRKSSDVPRAEKQPSSWQNAATNQTQAAQVWTNHHAYVSINSSLANTTPTNQLTKELTLGATNEAQTAIASSKKEPRKDFSTFPGHDLYLEARTILKRKSSDADLARAIDLLKQAAEKGNPPAQHALAVGYLEGLGMPKDSAKGVEWLMRSATNGYPEAEFKLASLYARGIGVEQNLTVAADWARKAAEAGNPEAQYNLATLYAAGLGVPRDATNAAIWFKKAAENGHPTAQSNLGVLYANGKIFPENFDEALKWWRKAAEQGQPSAQFNLAQALQEGKKAPLDLVEAYKWASLAAEYGDAAAIEARDSIALRMRPEEIAEGLKRAREFKTALAARDNERLMRD